MKLQKTISNLFQPTCTPNKILKATFLSNFWQHNEATAFPESTMQIYAYTISRENCVTSKVEKKNNSREITRDALKMQMRLEKRLRPKTVSYLLIMPTINPPDVCH